MKKIRIILFILSLFLFSLIISNRDVAVIAASDTYYNSIDNSLTGTALKLELRELITNTHSYKTSYDDCKNPTLVKKTDGDPNNSNNIILFWSGISRSASWDGGTSWNREHVWPKSLAWYDTSGAGSDMHHIRPTDASVNSTHSNDPYGIVSSGKYVKTSTANGGVTTQCKHDGSTFEPGDSKKGDTARIVFYLLTRYSEADKYTVTSVATSMEMLLEWNELDPVDSQELRRNDGVQSIQGNRNPFIDNANYANLIWKDANSGQGGNNQGPDNVNTLESFEKASTYTSLMLNYDYDGINEEKIYSYTFESQVYTANGTKALNGIKWTLAGNGGYWGMDTNSTKKGHQFGSKNKPYKSLTFTSESLQNIKSIKINTSGASDIVGSFNVSVGGVTVKNNNSLTKAATDYIFDLPQSLNGSIVFSFTQTSSKAIYIKSIEIVYGANNMKYNLNTASLRFGSYITKELYDTLNKSNTVWGVEYYVGNNVNWNSSNVKTAICTPAQVSKPNDNEVDVNGNYYQFALVISGLDYSHIDLVINARVFVEYDGVRYYMNSKSESLRSVANAYLSLSDTNDFSDHLGILKHLSNYEG